MSKKRLITFIGSLVLALAPVGLTHLLYYKPVLANHDEQIAKQGEQIAQKDREISALKSQWADAKHRYLEPLTDTIRDANKTEREWENKPHPSPRQFAEKIVKNRDALRDRITQMRNDLDTVYTYLNSDIDAIRDALAQQPVVSDAELRRLIGRLHTSQWEQKVKLIEDLMQKTFVDLGCRRSTQS